MTSSQIQNLSLYDFYWQPIPVIEDKEVMTLYLARLRSFFVLKSMTVYKPNNLSFTTNDSSKNILLPHQLISQRAFPYSDNHLVLHPTGVGKSVGIIAMAEKYKFSGIYKKHYIVCSELIINQIRESIRIYYRYAGKTDIYGNIRKNQEIVIIKRLINLMNSTNQ